MSHPDLQPVTVRRFDRRDRDQVTDLVNAHVAAVLPGVVVPVATVLATLEREPGEYVVDPWVSERVTLVAEVRRRVVAVAHLLRYAGGDDVGPGHRAAGEVRWLAALPRSADGADLGHAADALLVAAGRVFAAWGVTRQLADPALPAPAAYGVPDTWPHLRRALATAGYAPTRTEVVWSADPADLTGATDLEVARSVGCVGTRFTARRGGAELGHVEVAVLGDRARFGRGRAVADVGNLFVDPAHRRQGVGRQLLGVAADWLVRGDVGLLLAYTDPDDDDTGEAAFHRAVGLAPLVSVERGWERVLS